MSICEGLLKSDFVQNILVHCRSLPNKKVPAIDGQWQTAFNIRYKGVIDKKRLKGKTSADINVMHSVVADNMVLLYSPKSSERASEQASSIIEAVGADSKDEVEFIYSDNPVALDDRIALASSLPNVQAVGKDPIHPATKVEKAFGKNKNAFTVRYRRCLKKFSRPFDDGRPYYVKGCPTTQCVGIKERARTMTKKQAKMRVKKIDEHGYSDTMYSRIADFVRDVAALTRVYPKFMKRKPKGKKSTSVLNSVCFASSPVELEYLSNGPRFMARNPDVPMPYGTTPNEAVQGECAKYYTPVTQQRHEHARVVAGTITLRKLLDGALARVPLSRSMTKCRLLQTTANMMVAMDFIRPQ